MSTYEARFTCLVYGVNMSQSRDDSDNHELCEYDSEKETLTSHDKD